MANTVVLGITGGIAAYKTPDLIRSLRKSNIDIEVVMTRSAQEFVTQTTIREVSGHQVHSGLFESITDWDVQHISLAQKADLISVVPATANMIGKMATGIADDLLSSVLMATPAPILLAPAMNSGMYLNPAVQNNIRVLAERGVHFIGPAKGELLCGQAGIGRMSSLAEIEEAIITLLTPKDLEGYHFLITAGPTQEFWDPVRFLTNPSSGKMGHALARMARRRGAIVTLITGPVDLPPVPDIEVISVRTAQEMYDAVIKCYSQCDISIMAAAPTDYHFAETYTEKQKRNGGGLAIELCENPDIAREIGDLKGERFSVIFAAETWDMRKHAQEKLIYKNADLVVANDIKEEGSGFRSDTNRVILITKEHTLELPSLSKHDVANQILSAVRLLRLGDSLSKLN